MPTDIPIDELKNGSPQAFAWFVDRYSGDVIKICQRFTPNADDAQDIAQEVFIEIYRSIARFARTSELETWIYRISVNKNLDFLRKQKRKKRLADLKGLFLAKHKPSRTPADHLEDVERRELLYEHIAALPENQRIALLLNQDPGLSQKQIAHIMGTSESAVQSLLHRARSNLRKRLAHYFEKNL